MTHNPAILWGLYVLACAMIFGTAYPFLMKEQRIHNKEGQMARIEELKHLIQKNNEDFAKIAHSRWIGTAQWDILTEERHMLFTEMFALEDALEAEKA